ncbi:MAG TPA: type II toxin-antitoxin system RelE/ParE family toxin [Thermodesulfobacteriota bacterium]|nr:type II toxin-antitoxin system RelE/ParE family toxin [Thermodesulfobacteriota bacterium]
MIKDFADSETEKLYYRQKTKKLPAQLLRHALRKLLILDAAETIDDLRIPPGNRLEKLKGTRKGQHSIRINNQWRICFVWKDRDAYSVEITDYHS